jgi:hypothetical protein
VCVCIKMYHAQVMNWYNNYHNFLIIPRFNTNANYTIIAWVIPTHKPFHVSSKQSSKQPLKTIEFHFFCIDICSINHINIMNDMY